MQSIGRKAPEPSDAGAKTARNCPSRKTKRGKKQPEPAAVPAHIKPRTCRDDANRDMADTSTSSRAVGLHGLENQIATIDINRAAGDHQRKIAGGEQKDTGDIVRRGDAP